MESTKAGLTQAGRNIQDALERELVPNAHIRAARAALLEAFTSSIPAGDAAERVRFDRRWLIAIGAALLVLTGFGLWSQRPISFLVDGAPGKPGDAVEALSEAPVALTFSEGSSVWLRTGARARVLATEAARVRVLLEVGEAEVNVLRRTRGLVNWTLEVGPFQLHLADTKFLVGWDAATRSLAITMKEGSVLVSGPCLAGARAIGAGASLSLSCASALATDGARNTAADSTNSDSAMTDALLGVRERLPHSEQSAVAAFTLGRIALERESFERAARWFKTYLDELPGGLFAGDAAGLLMQTRSRQGDREAARVEAEHYLSLFPEGPYAAEARQILAP